MDKRPPDPIRHTMIRLPYKQEYMDEIMWHTEFMVRSSTLIVPMAGISWRSTWDRRSWWSSWDQNIIGTDPLDDRVSVWVIWSLLVSAIHVSYFSNRTEAFASDFWIARAFAITTHRRYPDRFPYEGDSNYRTGQTNKLECRLPRVAHHYIDRVHR
jgi:hypothetical protein